MDRGTRRLQKARIRARLRRHLEEKIWKEASRPPLESRWTVSEAQWRRWIYRDEGKRYSPRYTYTFERCDCGYCTDSRRYRTNREAERMEQDRRGWWTFGVGEGEE